MRPFALLRRSVTALLLALALTAGASAAAYGTGVVTASALHLRALPTTSSNSLRVVDRGSAVEILAPAANGWYKVSYDGTNGYMSAAYLDVTVNEPQTGLLGNGKVTLTSGWLNIRSLPSMEGERIGMIPNGTVVGLDSHMEGWYGVTYDGVTGYVAERYITPTDEAISPPETAVTGDTIITEAMKYLGCPYVYAAAGPDAFDCSGFTYYIYGNFGYSLTRSAASQFTYDGTWVSYDDLQPGDIVCFRDIGSSQAATHVGMYIGDDQFIHASSSTTGAYVRISSIMGSAWYSARFVGGKRIL